MASVGNPEDNPASASGGAWVRVARPDGEHVLVAGQFGSHREFGGVWALTGIVSVAIPAGAFAFAIAPTVERRIHPDADSVDLSVPLAANVEVAEGWRVGVEAIGQDLEDYLEGEEEEAEGGATWLAAAMVGWRGEHFEAGLAPGVGLAPSGVGFVGRARAAWRF